jgi:hypothetical protein
MSPTTKIITANELDAGAVIPQCLDNQYVSDNVFQYMTEKGVGFSDSDVEAMRDKEIRTELNRSLVYASQSIVNRAFFWNNRVFYSSFKESKENEANKLAFINLMKSKAIVPYLYKENDIAQLPKFNLDSEGVVTFSHLLSSLDSDMECLRFSPNDKKNEVETEKFQLQFTNYFLNFRARKEVLLRPIADGIIMGRDSASRNQRIEAFTDELKRWKKQVSDAANEELDEKETVSRDFLYKRFVCQDVEDAVAKGLYLSPKQDPFVLEKKKLFDLRYSTNLADALKRYTFVPSGLPTRSALAIDVDLGRGTGDDFLANIADNVRHTFMEITQEGLNLPLLRYLQMRDIYEIRTTLKSWEKYVSAQRKILKDPLNCLNYIDEFATSLQSFNSELSDWYIKQKHLPVIENKYRTIIRLIVKVAGTIIATKADDDVLKAALVWIQNLPDSALGLVVSLAVDFYDPARDEIVRDLGYSLDIVDYERDISKEAVTELIRKTQEFGKGKDTFSAYNQSAASQTKGQ